MKKRPFALSHILIFSLLFLFCLTGTALAETTRLVILHTNDNHDHVRLGYGGVGGLPRVSGYIKQVRSQEPNVLVLDAGDDAEKGDLVAFKTQSLLTYELLRRIGYDGIAIGNHDFDPHLVAGIRRFEKVLGQPMLCLNIVKPDGTPEFTPSRIVTIGGLKVGLIGMIVPRKTEFGGLDFEASGRALDLEAKRLGPHVDLLVAVCHEGVAKCALWSQAAPDVQIFISGHSHVSLLQPRVVPETGALIVQAGSYARWVGRLNLEVDAATNKITGYDYELVPMQEGTVPVDEEMLALVRQREQELCPEAREIVAHNDAPVTMVQTAWLSADALRRAAGTDLGFCHMGNVIRSELPAGNVDVNALYVAGGSRGDETLFVNLTGAQVQAYLEMLAGDQKWNQTTWSGMRVTRAGADHSGPITTSLQTDQEYSVIMPTIEWTTRFTKMAKHAKQRDPHGALAGALPKTTPSSAQLTEALRERAKQLTKQGETLGAEANALASAGTDTPNDNQWWWTGSFADIVDRHGETADGN